VTLKEQYRDRFFLADLDPVAIFQFAAYPKPHADRWRIITARLSSPS
jgi:hypothetical protein